VPAPPAPLIVPVTAALFSAPAPFVAACWAQTAVVEATLANTRANAYRKNLTDYLSYWERAFPFATEQRIT
jgi:hypothetical protein